MNTFVPYETFERCAQVLDDQRLGKQRAECKQILAALFGGSYIVVPGRPIPDCLVPFTNSHAHHPATRMWAGSEGKLCKYAIAICIEWRKRGYRDSQLPFFQTVLSQLKGSPLMRYPSWWGSMDVHGSHRAQLYRKNPEHYSQFRRYVKLYSDYVWPLPLSNEVKRKLRA